MHNDDHAVDEMLVRSGSSEADGKHSPGTMSTFGPKEGLGFDGLAHQSLGRSTLPVVYFIESNDRRPGADGRRLSAGLCLRPKGLCRVSPTGIDGFAQWPANAASSPTIDW
jgi:hypothetical protein